jgi:hypothetical protein
MKKILLCLSIFIMICGISYGSAPSRPNTYTSGTIIDPVAVTANENTLYTYLQAGVDTYKSGTITTSAISPTAGILYSQLTLTGSILNADLAGSIAASKLIGTDIATVGTITTGTWNGTSITASHVGPLLGLWTGPFNCSTIVQATTDGYVVGYNSSGIAQLTYSVLTDSSNPPTTIRGQSTIPSGGSFSSLFTPVKKNDYWEFTSVGAGGACNFNYFIGQSS